MRTLMIVALGSVLCLLGMWAPVQATILAWEPSMDATGYRVSYGRSHGHYDTMLEVGFATSVSIDGLLPGHPYYAVVNAYNDAGVSANSNEVRWMVHAHPHARQ